jgi:hypothetical protein
MRQRFLTVGFVVLAVLGLSVGIAVARPLGGAEQQQLLALYNRYNAAISAGRLDAALAMRAAPVRTAIEQQLKTPKDRQDYLDGAREMVPNRLELRHASINDAGDKAVLIALADKTLPSGPAQSELDMGFLKEAGAWKLGDLVQGPGPAEIQRCRDQSYQPISAYDTSKGVSVVGRIERVDFLPDHTLVVVLSGNTETCAFLPNRAALQQHGMNPSILEPYRIANISGVAGRNDPQKVMVNNITVHAEE